MHASPSGLHEPVPVVTSPGQHYAVGRDGGYGFTEVQLNVLLKVEELEVEPLWSAFSLPWLTSVSRSQVRLLFFFLILYSLPFPTEVGQPGRKRARNWQAEWRVEGRMLAVPSLPVLLCATALGVLGEHLTHGRGMSLMLIIMLPIFEEGSPNSRASCNTCTRTLWPRKDALYWKMLVWGVALLGRVNGNPT